MWLDKYDKYTESDMKLSFSKLMIALKNSWKKYRYLQQKPFVMGAEAQYSRLFHQLLLEPDTNISIKNEPNCNLRTAKGKEDFHYWASTLVKNDIVVAQFREAKNMIERLNRSDVTVIHKDDFQRANLMASAVKQRKFWQYMHSKDDCEYEKKGEYQHNDVWLRFKMDMISRELGIIADLKLVPSINPDQISKKVFENMLDVQSGIYTHCGGKLDDIEYTKYVLICVETEEPYQVQEYQIPYELIDQGWRIACKKIEEFKHCVTWDEWPEMFDVQQEMNWPTWMQYRREELINE